MKIKTDFALGRLRRGHCRILAASLAASMPASAADLSPRPMYKAPPMEPPPQFSWTGCYVGGNAGYGMASRKWNTVATTPTTAFVSQHTSGGGFVGGGQLGCDYQAGNWVVGIEGMVGRQHHQFNTSIGNVLPGASLTDKVTSFETLTGRLGWAADRSLFYVKAGAPPGTNPGAINEVRRAWQQIAFGNQWRVGRRRRLWNMPSRRNGPEKSNTITWASAIRPSIIR